MGNPGRFLIGNFHWSCVSRNRGNLIGRFGVGIVPAHKENTTCCHGFSSSSLLGTVHNRWNSHPLEIAQVCNLGTFAAPVPIDTVLPSKWNKRFDRSHVDTNLANIRCNQFLRSQGCTNLLGMRCTGLYPPRVEIDRMNRVNKTSFGKIEKGVKKCGHYFKV